MKVSVDISLYPLTTNYEPVVRAFIDRLETYEDVAVVRNDLATQVFGDYDRVMTILRDEMKTSWDSHGKGVFTIKFLPDDLRGLADG